MEGGEGGRVRKRLEGGGGGEEGETANNCDLLER